MNTYRFVANVTLLQSILSYTVKWKWFAASVQTALNHTLSCIVDNI